MKRKERERAILHMVYGNNELREVVDGESPDFRVKRVGQDVAFGVEVTEFYFSESNAGMVQNSRELD
jgi:hypothetical protein